MAGNAAERGGKASRAALLLGRPPVGLPRPPKPAGDAAAGAAGPWGPAGRAGVAAAPGAKVQAKSGDASRLPKSAGRRAVGEVSTKPSPAGGRAGRTAALLARKESARSNSNWPQRRQASSRLLPSATHQNSNYHCPPAHLACQRPGQPGAVRARAGRAGRETAHQRRQAQQQPPAMPATPAPLLGAARQAPGQLQALAALPGLVPLATSSRWTGGP